MIRQRSILLWLLFYLSPIMACQGLSRPDSPPINTPRPTFRVTIPDPAIATPTLPPTSTQIPTPTAIPTQPPTTTPSPTAVPWLERTTLGNSVQERPIQMVRYGTGPRWLVLMAALHGGHECNTAGIVNQMAARIETDPALLPAAITLFIVPTINPDGCALNTRENARGVDLNRNWNTDDWITDAEGPYGIKPGSGGPYPFSEPESWILQSWLLGLRDAAHEGPLRLISYHSAVPAGLVQPGYITGNEPEPFASELALIYSNSTGYPYSTVWVGNYTITGESIHWASRYGIVAIDVELPDRNPADSVPAGRNESHLETNWRALLSVLATIANQ